MSTLLIVIFSLIGLIVLWLIFTFNSLIRLRNRKEEASSDIEVQSKRRYDLIPNLVETVKGYAAHERGVLENVTQARAAAMQAEGSPIEKAEKENMLS
ncbi:MAG: LemA family protein, partial [bacterium]|nr:LemA family protein [bacterium]